ncbi:helix-hairpin-helix domain-containing protein [Virgibacillus sp. C22-A2]|uniref:Helix-hairpin-helix domain-containing protein n=1 Tax=Virgibacillus tibetensis TaxID=3042313 RepID=A0ABU6KF40_9BACI|nr:helix-hairpin-helix domain-containing protein [Virgibacillus sp. C22-A2]
MKISELHEISEDRLTAILHISDERSRFIKGLAEFQQIPSIGQKLAEKIVYHLGIYTLHEIKDNNAAELFDKLEEQMGVWTDPCVEDQLRCVIYHANHPDSNKEKDIEKERYGYRGTRPTKAWYK